MLNILITGHSGAVGSRLAKKFDKFIGIDTKDGKDLLTCELPLEVDLIYHLAAHASVEDSWKDPVREMENITTTVRLAHIYPNAKIIYAATCAAINPASPYGFSKKCAADYLKIFHPNTVFCVFPNIFETGRSVVDFFKGKDKVIVYGSGLHKRDYVHVDDIVEGLVKAKDWEAGEYFMGSGEAHTVLELAEGKEIVFMPERKEAIESLIPNTTPNWKPIINVIEYLK
jgi:UDP-glucose 4-epimerase